MTTRPPVDADNRTDRSHTAVKWLLTLLSGVLAFSFVILLNEQL